MHTAAVILLGCVCHFIGGFHNSLVFRNVGLFPASRLIATGQYEDQADLRVELHAVEAAALIADAHGGTGGGAGGQPEALRHGGHVVPMAHPGHALLRQTPEQWAGGVEEGARLAVLPRGVVLRRGDAAAQRLRQQLAAVADAEDGQAEREDRRIDGGRAGRVNRARAAGEDDADGVEGADGRKRRIVRQHLAVNVALAHAAGDELVVLAAEIQDQDLLHARLLFPTVFCHNDYRMAKSIKDSIDFAAKQQVWQRMIL